MLNRLVEEALDREFSLSSIRQKDLAAESRRQAETEKKKMEKEIEECCYKADQLEKAGSEDYIRYRLGELEEDAMAESAKRRKKDIEKLYERKKLLSRRLSEMDAETEKRNHYLRMLMKCRKGTPFSAEVLHGLIERIEVFPDKRILIHFAFSGREINALGGGVKL